MSTLIASLPEVIIAAGLFALLVHNSLRRKAKMIAEDRAPVSEAELRQLVDRIQRNGVEWRSA